MAEQHTPAAWEDVATEVTEAVAAVIGPQVRKVADDLYEHMMVTVQDYLADNLRFNLSSRLESAERENARLHKECYILGLQRSALMEALTFILPMAKGYASANRVGRNAEMIAEAEALLSPLEASVSVGLKGVES